VALLSRTAKQHTKIRESRVTISCALIPTRNRPWRIEPPITLRPALMSSVYSHLRGSPYNLQRLASSDREWLLRFSNLISYRIMVEPPSIDGPKHY